MDSLHKSIDVIVKDQETCFQCFYGVIVKISFFRTIEFIYAKSRSRRPEVFCKKVILKISQNFQENTCARVSFLIKLRS